MYKRLALFFAATALFTQLSAQVIKIRDARAMALGATVTVRGIATNGAEVGQTIRYIQDSTAGLAIFYTLATNPTFANIKRGDSIEVTGVLKDFNSLLEIDPITSFRVLNSNNPVPTPLSISASGMAEINESKLVRLLNGSFTGASGVFVGNTSYNLTVGGTNIVVRINTGSALVGRSIPTAAIDVVGLCSDFRGAYQILPRDSADFIFQGIAITTPATVTNQTQTGLTLNWQTSLVGTSEVAFGLTPALGQRASVAGTRSAHSVPLSNLQPATVVYARVVSQAANGTKDSSRIYTFITNSASTGETRVYFNKSVDASVRTGNNAPTETTGARCEAELVTRIAQSRSTIDIAMYNTASTAIKTALQQAAQRGVRVRYLADRTTSNTIYNDTTGLGFRFQRSANPDLMHNKFMVFDADSVTKSWVSTGSMNQTTFQIMEDPNNMVLIQDQSLAKIYRMEFDEMWGSSTAVYNATNAKAGAFKTDNTPHQVVLSGNRLAEVYFSPSDATSSAIIRAINSANTDLEMGIMIFTYFDLGTAVNNAKRRGVDTRGVLHWDTATASTQPLFLARNGTQIRYWKSGQNIFHHKYVIIDAKNTASDPAVVTGSHNWSNSAEVRNDENTIILHDPAVANIFLQEFEARWKEAPVATQDIDIQGFTTNLFPNPASEILTVKFKTDAPKDVTLTVVNSLGQPLESRILRQIVGENTQNYPLSNWAAGQYFLHFSVDGKTMTRAFQVVK
jgi:phosphatidylserine/phosphatidylglycerophosphate/cardiolipin synthase-like enzyme/DNA/RNA endonuclease YhcR with UshA esterase domain